MMRFYAPRKRQKASGFLTFQGLYKQYIGSTWIIVIQHFNGVSYDSHLSLLLIFFSELYRMFATLLPYSMI